MHTIQENDKDFIVAALNGYWLDAHTNLQRKHLGDIERDMYEKQLARSKKLMTELEDGKRKGTLISNAQFDSLKTKIYNVLMDSPENDMAEMGDCATAANDLILEWMLANNVRIIEEETK